MKTFHTRVVITFPSFGMLWVKTCVTVSKCMYNVIKSNKSTKVHRSGHLMTHVNIAPILSKRYIRKQNQKLKIGTLSQNAIIEIWHSIICLF